MQKAKFTPMGTLVAQHPAGQELDVIVSEGKLYIPFAEIDSLLALAGGAPVHQMPVSQGPTSSAAVAAEAPATRKGRGPAKAAAPATAAVTGASNAPDVAAIRGVFTDLEGGLNGINGPEDAMKKLATLIPADKLPVAQVQVDAFMANATLVATEVADVLIAGLSGTAAASPAARKGRGAAAATAPPPPPPPVEEEVQPVDPKSLKVGEKVEVELLQPLVTEDQEGFYPATVKSMGRGGIPTFTFTDDNSVMTYNPKEGFGGIFYID